jgi:prepilin signal peptidase PulO-like enzyme (type II secretory pathway)
MNVVAGAVIGALMAPLVYLLAAVLLQGPARVPRTPLALTTLLAACIAAGVAITTSASIMIEETLTVRGSITGVAYGLFAVGVLAAALVDIVERRIPNRITYPLIVSGVLGLPWLAQPITGWAVLVPLLGAAASGVIALVNALLADQGLGDVKLAVAVGAWMAHLGLVAWVSGILFGQLLMIGAVVNTQIRRRRAGLPPSYTPLGPSLAGGAVLAVAVAGFQI